MIRYIAAISIALLSAGLLTFCAPHPAPAYHAPQELA